jgi:hypothetical protein
VLILVAVAREQSSSPISVHTKQRSISEPSG